SEREAEKEAGDQTDAARHEFLGVNEDRGECGSEDRADDDTERNRRAETRMGKRERERSDAKDGEPDHIATTESVAEGATQNGAGGNSEQKNEQVELSAPHRHIEPFDEIERVVVGEADQIDVF